jgi:hypothetical protein
MSARWEPDALLVARWCLEPMLTAVILVWEPACGGNCPRFGRAVEFLSAGYRPIEGTTWDQLQSG